MNGFSHIPVMLEECMEGLDVHDVDTSGRVLKVTGKRNKQRIVPFGDELQALLDEYSDARKAAGIDGEGALFVDGKGKRRGERTGDKFFSGV